MVCKRGETPQNNLEGVIKIKDKNLFSVGDFAKLSRTTAATLHHYDKIGLLSPVTRGQNNYRYYTSGQLAVINVIRILQQLGMTLDEMKTLRNQRTPEQVSEIFMNQAKSIDEKIEGWVSARKLMMSFRQTIQSVMNIDEEAITIQFLPAEAIILGDLNDYSRGQTAYEALLGFYSTMREKYPDLNLNYPVWGCFSAERIIEKDWIGPERYYFYNPEGHDKRPAALYAVGYHRGGYGDTDTLYERMLTYISENNFEICGNTYEEYPLNEVSISDPNNYLIRLLITVREKNGRRNGKPKE